jgi:uncharacterized membrane protein YciS (DUF1049 family)
MRLVLLRSNSALITLRYVIYTNTLLMSSLLGSVFGLMNAFGVAMGVFEGFVEDRQKCIKAKKKLRKIVKRFRNMKLWLGNENHERKNTAVEETVGYFEQRLNSLSSTEFDNSSQGKSKFGTVVNVK